MTTQSAAPTSIPVEDKQEEVKPAETPVTASSSPDPVSGSKSNDTSTTANQDSVAFMARTALQDAVREPKRFKKWTKPTHGLSLSILEPKTSAEQFCLLLVAVKNKTSDTLKLSPDIPELFIEMLDERGKPLNIESINKIYTEASDTSGVIPKGGITYYAVAYTPPVLNVRQQLRVSVGQTSAADEPASIVLARSGK